MSATATLPCVLDTLRSSEKRAWNSLSLSSFAGFEGTPEAAFLVQEIISRLKDPLSRPSRVLAMLKAIHNMLHEQVEGVTSLLEDILPALVSFAQKNKDSSRLFCAAGAVLMEFTRAACSDHPLLQKLLSLGTASLLCDCTSATLCSLALLPSAEHSTTSSPSFDRDQRSVFSPGSLASCEGTTTMQGAVGFPLDHGSGKTGESCFSFEVQQGDFAEDPVEEIPSETTTSSSLDCVLHSTLRRGVVEEIPLSPPALIHGPWKVKNASRGQRMVAPLPMELKWSPECSPNSSPYAAAASTRTLTQEMSPSPRRKGTWRNLSLPGTVLISELDASTRDLRTVQLARSLRYSVGSLANIAQSEEGASHLLENRIVTILEEALRLVWHGEDKVLECVCKLFLNMCKNQNFCSQFCNTGGLLLVLQTLEAQKESPGALTLLFRGMSRISSQPEHLAAFLAVPDLLAVALECIELHGREDARLVEYVCSFLTHISADERGQLALCQQHPVPILLGALKDHATSDSRSLALCLSTLTNLNMNAWTRRVLANADCLPFLLQLAIYQELSPRTQIMIFHLLQNLSALDMTTKEEMVRFRAINVLWDCLERCDTTAEILDPVLGCLSNLACAENAVEDLEKHPFVVTLLKILRKHAAGCPQVVKHGCSALSNICANNPGRKIQALHSSALPLLRNLNLQYQDHPITLSVIDHSIITLTGFSLDEGALEQSGCDWAEDGRRIFEGFLWKKGGLWKRSWQRRFFVLHSNGTVAQFKTKEAASKLGARPRSHFSLLNGICSPSEESVHRVGGSSVVLHTFKLVPTLHGPILLGSTDAAEASLWMWWFTSCFCLLKEAQRTLSSPSSSSAI